ncbi:MAG: hypothetical protein V3U03_01115 [Myxococcota bacterium]
MGIFKRKWADTPSAEARQEELRSEAATAQELHAEARAAFEQAALTGDRAAIDEARSAVDSAAARERELAAGIRASERDVARARDEQKAQERAAHRERAAEHARERLKCAERFDDLARQLGNCCAEYAAASLAVDVELGSGGLDSRKLATATHWHLLAPLWFNAPELCTHARLAPLIGGKKQSLAEASAPEAARVDAMEEEPAA